MAMTAAAPPMTKPSVNRWLQLDPRRGLHGRGREYSICLDALRSGDPEDLRLGSRGDPGRLHDLRRGPDLADPDRGLLHRQVRPEPRGAVRRPDDRPRLGDQLLRHLAHRLLCRFGGGRHRRRLRLRHLHQQRPEVVPGQARPRGRPDGGRLRRGLGADDHPDRQHDLAGQLRPGLLHLRADPGRHHHAGGHRPARAGQGRGRLLHQGAADPARLHPAARPCARRCSG